jgi:aspartate/tyrosine/aromatic aminotransferase
MGSVSHESLFASLSDIPLDPHYALKELFHSDTDPEKVILGSGLYRDDNSKPWVLPTIQLVSITFRSHLITRQLVKIALGRRNSERDTGL